MWRKVVETYANYMSWDFTYIYLSTLLSQAGGQWILNHSSIQQPFLYLSVLWLTHWKCFKFCSWDARKYVWFRCCFSYKNSSNFFSPITFADRRSFLTSTVATSPLVILTRLSKSTPKGLIIVEIVSTTAVTSELWSLICVESSSLRPLQETEIFYGNLNDRMKITRIFYKSSCVFQVSEYRANLFVFTIPAKLWHWRVMEPLSDWDNIHLCTALLFSENPVLPPLVLESLLSVCCITWSQAVDEKP